MRFWVLSSLISLLAPAFCQTQGFMERASESVLPVFKSTGAPGIDLSLLWKSPRRFAICFPLRPFDTGRVNLR